MAFDKTGTLTEGNFTVCGVHSVGKISNEELLSLVGVVESASSHPIAKAFFSRGDFLQFDEIKEVKGQGMVAMNGKDAYLVGNAKLLDERGVFFEKMESAYTVVYVSKNEEYLGCIEVGDKVRTEAKEALAQLKHLGVKRMIILTGDGRIRAEKIANQLGMSEVKSELLPIEKMEKAQELKGFGKLLYVGDGINDAPVMSVADCSASMGKLGSAAAVETSDFVLISDDLLALPCAFKIAKKTRKVVVQNIIFSILMKFGFMLLGVMGILPLWLAVFADVGVMLLAVLNSFRLRFFR